LWFQYSEYFGFIDELEKQKKACHQMEEILKERGVDVKTKIYPFFEYNIHYNFGLAYPVTVPYMVIINPDQSLESDIFDIVVYDVRKEIFRIFTVERFGMIYLTPFMGNPDYFSDSIIVIIMELASGNAETIIQYVEETINY
jgi:flavodoxin